MKLDRDIRAMGSAELRRELMRVRSLVRTHKKRKDNARCWHADLELYARILPEGDKGAGKMKLPEHVLLRNCWRYVQRQQCTKYGCKGKRSN